MLGDCNLLQVDLYQLNLDDLIAILDEFTQNGDELGHVGGQLGQLPLTSQNSDKSDRILFCEVLKLRVQLGDVVQQVFDLLVCMGVLTFLHVCVLADINERLDGKLVDVATDKCSVDCFNEHLVGPVDEL